MGSQHTAPRGAIKVRVRCHRAKSNAAPSGEVGEALGGAMRPAVGRVTGETRRGKAARRRMEPFVLTSL
jgi:hypothetical protein